MNWVAWVKFALELAVQILPLILAIEKEIGAGNGEIKKQLVTNQMILAAKLAGANDEQVEKVKNTAATEIDTTVKVLNAAGTLKKTEGE